jgi:hypothetical protein
MITTYAISHFYITQCKLNGLEASQTFSMKRGSQDDQSLLEALMPPILFLSLSRRESRIASRLLSLPSLVVSPAREERGEKASLR